MVESSSVGVPVVNVSAKDDTEKKNPSKNGPKEGKTKADFNKLMDKADFSDEDDFSEPEDFDSPPVYSKPAAKEEKKEEEEKKDGDEEEEESPFNEL